MREAAIERECSTHWSDVTLVKYSFTNNLQDEVNIYDENNGKIKLKKFDVTIWTEFIWLESKISDGLLRIW
jgi:hypothetical protein